ncbi:hypothetical protein PCE1_004488 [Barthelona sp. PCE]
MGEQKRFTAEQISAFVLSHMKQCATEFLGVEVTDAVVTVPAYFNDAQRSATRDAGEIAGLNVLRIINEPTAAAVAYGVSERSEDERKVLVFDLGGGTFDVSLLCVEGGFLEVLATAGDTHLGGSDFDNRLVTFLASEFTKETGIDISNNARAKRRLRTHCERAKRTLSSATQHVLDIEALAEGEDFEYTLTRAKFEELNMDLFRGCLEPVQQVLRDSDTSKNEVDEILLVGGSTRIPKVRQLLKDFFNGKTPNQKLNPDEAVAMGAAIQAHLLYEGPDETIGDVLLVDVAPLSLGIETLGERMAVLIPRGTKIPCSKSETFSTAADNQTSVNIRIFEGERPLCANNNLLGQFMLSNIAPAPRGSPKIEVVFEVDESGIMKVKATDSGTGNSESITIDNDKDRLSKEQIDQMIKEAKQHEEQDRIVKETIDARNELESYTYSIKSSLTTELEGKLSGEDVATIQTAVEETMTWFEANKATAGKDDFSGKKEELQNKIMPIMAKVYAEGQPGAGAPGAGFPGAGAPGAGFPGAGFPGAGAPGAGAAPQPQVHVEDVD